MHVKAPAFPPLASISDARRFSSQPPKRPAPHASCAFTYDVSYPFAWRCALKHHRPCFLVPNTSSPLEREAFCLRLFRHKKTHSLSTGNPSSAINLETVPKMSRRKLPFVGMRSWWNFPPVLTQPGAVVNNAIPILESFGDLHRPKYLKRLSLLVE